MLHLHLGKRVQSSDNFGKRNRSVSPVFPSISRSRDTMVCSPEITRSKRYRTVSPDTEHFKDIQGVHMNNPSGNWFDSNIYSLSETQPNVIRCNDGLLFPILPDLEGRSQFKNMSSNMNKAQNYVGYSSTSSYGRPTVVFSSLTDIASEFACIML